MNTVRMALVAMLAVAASAATRAQTTVYKCTTADGLVFSGQPCAKSPKHMQVLHLKRPPPPDPAAMARAADAARSMAASIHEDKLNAQERVCYANMTSNTDDRTAAQIAVDRQQMANLRNQLGYAANNMAGATWENGIKRQIAALRASIDTQQQIRSQNRSTASTVCANDRRAAVRATHKAAAANP